MIEVYCSKLNKQIKSMEKLIKEYENIQLNLFNQLKNSCNDWKDTASVEFDNKIVYEKLESENILEYLTQNKEVLAFVYSSYIDIGKKIKCNLNNKNSVVSKINECIQKFDDLINSFNEVDSSFSYSEYGAIMAEKNRMVIQKETIVDVKTKLIETFEKIKTIEENTSSLIGKIEKIAISEFNY